MRQKVVLIILPAAPPFKPASDVIISRWHVGGACFRMENRIMRKIIALALLSVAFGAAPAPVLAHYVGKTYGHTHQHCHVQNGKKACHAHHHHSDHH